MNNKNVTSSLTVIIIINIYVKKLAKALFGHGERFIKFVYQCLRYFVTYAITYRTDQYLRTFLYEERRE